MPRCHRGDIIKLRMCFSLGTARVRWRGSDFLLHPAWIRSARWAGHQETTPFHTPDRNRWEHSCLQFTYHLSTLGKKRRAKDRSCAARDALRKECLCDLVTQNATFLMFTEKKKAGQYGAITSTRCIAAAPTNGWTTRFVFSSMHDCWRRTKISLWHSDRNIESPVLPLAPMVLPRNNSQILINRK